MFWSDTDRTSSIEHIVRSEISDSRLKSQRNLNGISTERGLKPPGAAQTSTKRSSVEFAPCLAKSNAPPATWVRLSSKHDPLAGHSSPTRYYARSRRSVSTTLARNGVEVGQFERRATHEGAAAQSFVRIARRARRREATRHAPLPPERERERERERGVKYARGGFSHASTNTLF